MISIIQKEQNINKNSEIPSENNDDEPEGIFERKDDIILSILGDLLAGAIIPLVLYLKEEAKGNQDFEMFMRYATTNHNIFYDFARYVSKNYIFENNWITESSGKHTKNIFNLGTKERFLNREEFKEAIKEIYPTIFEPKMIRRRFLEFVSRHEERALNRLPTRWDPSIISDSENYSAQGKFSKEF